MAEMGSNGNEEAYIGQRCDVAQMCAALPGRLTDLEKAPRQHNPSGINTRAGSLSVIAIHQLTWSLSFDNRAAGDQQSLPGKFPGIVLNNGGCSDYAQVSYFRTRP